MKPNESKSNGNKMKPKHNATQYTKQFKNTIIQIERNEMKPNVNKSNRKQTKLNETNYIIQYITLQHTIQYNTIQYNKHYNPNTENPEETK